MSNNPPRPQVSLSDDANATFLIRWRGRQEGPYTVAVIDAKLAANQIGLLHEVSNNGQWVTLRDYFAEREAAVRTERQARDEEERRAREEAELRAKEREDRHRAELVAEERRKNDLLETRSAERQSNESFRQGQPIIRKPHRAGTILALGIIGLFVCGPLCVAAWVMGGSDLREMDAGIMDDSGRSTTSSGRTLGILGTILWIIGAIVIFII
jgi:hypothetical protein